MINDREVYNAFKAAIHTLATEEDPDVTEFLKSVRKAHKGGYITMDELIDLYTDAGRFIHE